MNNETKTHFFIQYNANDPQSDFIPISKNVHTNTYGKALLHSFLAVQENGIPLDKSQDANAITIRMINNRENNTIDVTYFVYPARGGEDVVESDG